MFTTTRIQRIDGKPCIIQSQPGRNEVNRRRVALFTARCNAITRERKN